MGKGEGWQESVGLQRVEPSPTCQIVLGAAIAGSAQDKTHPLSARFLRSIPTDPMTNSEEWGFRSMQDDPDSDSWGGQNMFDVYTKSQATALDGTKYKDW